MPKRVITSIDEMETWESSIDGTIWVNKFDRRGDVVQEMVKGHGKVAITPEERRYNQERVVTADLDPFVNGMLLPLKLVESAEDFEQLKGNPNHLTEEDMRAMLENPKDIAGLEEGLAKISNPSTLQRIKMIAQHESVDATIRQVNAIDERLAILVQEPLYQEVEVVAGPDGEEAYASSAPPSVAPRRRSAGRR